MVSAARPRHLSSCSFFGLAPYYSRARDGDCVKEEEAKTGPRRVDMAAAYQLAEDVMGRVGVQQHQAMRSPISPRCRPQSVKLRSRCRVPRSPSRGTSRVTAEPTGAAHWPSPQSNLIQRRIEGLKSLKLVGECNGMGWHGWGWMGCDAEEHL